MPETVLIVDDEEGVRRTFVGWLRDSGLSLEVFDVADASSALALADERPIDLAVLDWNLGAGSDGLQLLRDLYEFQPDITAILITGYAHQATPLDALRMGVRDYLDKNQTLTYEVFTESVRKQLERIAPAKREREITRRLGAFRDAVKDAVPLARTAAAMGEGVPLPEAARSLFRFAMRTTGAADGVLILRQTEGGEERLRAVAPNGRDVTTEPIPFSRSLAAAVASFGRPVASNIAEFADGVTLQPFERDKRNLLAGPITVGGDVQVILELFDKQGGGGFTDEDKATLASVADLGAELFRQALAQRHTNQMLIDAVGAAVEASNKLSAGISGTPDSPDPAAEPGDIMDRLREVLSAEEFPEDAGALMNLAEAVRELSQTYGAGALRHCADHARSVKRLLDEISGSAET